MTDYKKLVEALRIHTSADIECDECAYYDDCRLHGTGQTKMIADAADAIEALQAQLQKRGEWIIVDEWKNTLGDKLMKIKCPFCNKRIKLYEQPMPKYCDSCGAKMEVQE